MPLFEFSCRTCGHRFETFVTGTRKPECPACQSADLEKLFSSFGARTGGGHSATSSSTFT